MLARIGAFWQDYFYGAIGIAWQDCDWKVGSTKRSNTQTGWTWGFGFEHQITSSLRARVEYRAGEYDNETLHFGGRIRSIDPDTQPVTVGLSFAFQARLALIGLSRPRARKYIRAMLETPETNDVRRRKRLRFRAWHRGIREADLILGPFFDTYVDALDATDLDAFEALLAVPDNDLHDWFTGREPAPSHFDASLIDRIRAYAHRQTA